MPNLKTIEAADLWKIKRPASLSLSPDGSQTCAAVTGYDMESNLGSTHLWLLSTFGGAPRQLTSCGEKDGGCRWSPDGASIAFVAKRGEGAGADKEPQAYLISPDGARRVSNIATGVSAIKIKTGIAKNLTKPRSPRPSAKQSRAPSRSVAVAEAEADADASFTHHHPAYSVDGKCIALLVNNFGRSINDDTKLAVIERKSNQLKLVSQRWDRMVNAPLKWAADSQSVYFTADDHSRLSVWQMHLGEDEPALVAPGGTVTDFDVKADTLVFVRNHMSAAPKVFAASAAGKHAKPIESFNDALMAQFKMGEVREFTIKGWNGEAVQMWACYPPNFDPKKKWPLVHSIHGGLHANWGDNFHFRWNNQVFAAQGYVVVCVNYHGSVGWGNKYLESNMGVLGTKEHADIEAGTDFMLSQGYIDANRLAATGGSYGGMMVAWMNGRNGQPGANTKASRAKPLGDRYKAYVCHAGCYDWVNQYSEDVGGYFNYELKAKYWENPEKMAAQNPITFARYMKTPTLVIHGALDYRVPDAQGLLYYNALKSLNVESRLVFFPDENHWIVKPQNSRLWYREYFAWLEKYVGKGNQGTKGSKGTKGSGGAIGIKRSLKKAK